MTAYMSRRDRVWEAFREAVLAGDLDTAEAMLEIRRAEGLPVLPMVREVIREVTTIPQRNTGAALESDIEQLLSVTRFTCGDPDALRLMCVWLSEDGDLWGVSRLAFPLTTRSWMLRLTWKLHGSQREFDGYDPALSDVVRAALLGCWCERTGGGR